MPAKTAKAIYLETFGCQMNELDSELVRGNLGALGYTFTSESNNADIILYNTCSVREQAENKVLSRVGRVGEAKRETGRRVILGVIGCMAEREGANMIRRFPQIDLMCGPGELDKLPMLLDNVMKTEAVEVAERIALQGSNSRRSSTLAAAEDNLEMLDLSRAFDPDRAAAGGRSAYVRITRGCNKFCTYCVVPHTRGPEVHRPPDAIVDECRKLADQGVIEITLLGQTVNHYIYTHGIAVSVNGSEVPQVGPGAAAFVKKNSSPLEGGGWEGGEPQDVSNGSTLPPTPSLQGRGSRPHAAQRVTTFAQLLKRIHDEVSAIQRLRFVTSFPRDFGDDILQVMAESPRICRYLHVPAQSGSNRVLKLMNRGYSVEQYMDFIHRVRQYLPDACIGGDVIVGFPTETDEDFEMTRDLVRKVRFKNNFIFKYSPRPGTVAIKRFEDDVPEPVKRQRNNELLALQSEISAEIHREYIGRSVNVFVEQLSQRSARRKAAKVELGWERSTGTVAEQTRIQMSGRTDGDLIVVFDLPDGASPDDMIGTIVPVPITGSGPLILHGQV